MQEFSIAMAFVMGLTGSLHCVGMCGPIVWMMPFQMMNGYKKVLVVGLYHLGRITVYAMLGLLLYSFKSLFHPEWQQWISIGLGVVLLVVGLATFFPGRFSVALPWTGVVKRLFGKFLSQANVGSMFIAGGLNGLLPCGLVYMALSSTMAADSATAAMAMMYAFGLGTAPALITITILKKNIGAMFRNVNVKRLVPIAMFILGGLFVLRGMNLGIPYVSPKVAVAHNEIKASCCHKQ